MVRALQTVSLAGLLGVSACYSPPEPYCGFYCGPNSECPPAYACTTAGVCRHESAPASVTCGPDAAVGTEDSQQPTDGFGSGDTTAPTLAVATPPPGANNVPKTSTITVTFSEPVFDVTQSTFYVYADALVIDGTIMATGSPPDFATYHYTPSAPLPGNAPVTVVLTSSIHDAVGNALVTPGAGQLTYTFTTEP